MKNKDRALLLITLVLLLASFFYPEARKVLDLEENYVEAVDISESFKLIGEGNPVRERMELWLLNYKVDAARSEQNLLIDEYALAMEQETLIEEPEEEPEEEKLPAVETVPLVETVPWSGKTAYLTFDDGPSENVTSMILGVLDEYDVKATFFVLGKMVERNPEILKEVYVRGHSIGNHTYSHNYEHIYLSGENFLQEVYQTEELIRLATGDNSYKTSLVRLPGGSSAEYKKEALEAVEDAGLKSYDWNALNGDSDGFGLSPDYLYKRFTETYRQQDQTIILMHDTDEKETTVQALPTIIEHLLREGYQFRTLDDFRE